MATKFQTPAVLLGLAQDMITKGWQPVWAPARQNGSFSPEPGCTGSVEYMGSSVLPQPKVAHKLAFRPPLNVLVIDVDHYDDKHGMDTIDRAEAWLCPLPLTYRVTSRGEDNPSGRYLYRIPEDLLVTDSSLYQFADPETGKTDVEIVRTGHRFSWAPGDYHYKNNAMIQCFDEMGDECDLPDVEELPELPERWVAYFRNPPIPQKHEAYTRPSDGADWWLSQADDSLSSDQELAGFAYNMMLSRVPEEEIFEQWQRVARADNPAWPWERKDFDRHVGSRAQQKVDQILAHQDMETEWFAGTGADLERIAQQQTELYDNKQSLRAVVEPEIPFDRQKLEQIAAPAGIFFDDDEPSEGDEFYAPQPKTIDQLIRSLPEYDRMLWQEVARGKAKQDAAKILAGEFTGWEDISEIQDPAAPSLLLITGKDKPATAVISEKTVTVLSARRASGKTWMSSLWAEQIITRGGHVVWLDFERQPSGLAQKIRALGVPQHLMKNQLHYSSKLPPVDRLTADIRAYAANGKPVLFVVDAFRTLQGVVVPGSNANDGDAVEQVYIDYLTPAVNAGATVVLIDHIAKNGDGSTFGSERKESAADYVIRLEKVIAFTKVKPGFASLTCGKDRYGLIAEGDPVGYLWMPGDGSKSGKSIDQYPFSPALRNWSPMEDVENQAVELSLKGQRELAITTVVRDNPLRYGPRELGRQVVAVYPDLFVSDKAATDFASRMRSEGKLTKEDGREGKYNLVEGVMDNVFKNGGTMTNVETGEVHQLLRSLNPEDDND